VARDHGVAATVAAATGVMPTPRARRSSRASRLRDRSLHDARGVATLVTLLASGRTANVTGANYVIDGGLIKTT